VPKNVEHIIDYLFIDTTTITMFNFQDEAMIVGVDKFLFAGGRSTATVLMLCLLAENSRRKDWPLGKHECQLLTV